MATQSAYYLCWLTLIPALALGTGIDPTRFNEGKRQYELMQKQSERPKYGQCWISAMTTIHFGCKQLTDDTQTRLSLAYLNCFLEVCILTFCHFYDIFNLKKFSTFKKKNLFAMKISFKMYTYIYIYILLKFIDFFPSIKLKIHGL